MIASTSIGALLLLGCIVAVVCCKRRNSCSKLTYTVEVRPGQDEVQDSPIFCEVDIFQFSSSEPRSETDETVDTQVDEPTHVESNSEDEYCYPEIIENEYETMNPPQASAEYAYAYSHVNVNAGFMNTFPRRRPTNGVEDDCEYPLKSRSFSDNEYGYAYDWRNPGFREDILSSCESVEGYTPLDKDKVQDDNFYGRSYQSLSRENREKKSETAPLEYVTAL
jgi:hypothetical protein